MSEAVSNRNFDTASLVHSTITLPVCQTVSLERNSDSGHFAFASLGSYPATISHTKRVLRHVLTNDLSGDKYVDNIST